MAPAPGTPWPARRPALVANELTGPITGPVISPVIEPLDDSRHGPRTGPPDGGPGEGFHDRLLSVARRYGSVVSSADTTAAVRAGAQLCADERDWRDPLATVDHLAMAAAEVTRLELPADATRPLDWSPFGRVVPVLAGSPGAGASVLAAALADALQRAGRCVLLVDAAEPTRSGLAAAAAAEGPWVHRLHRYVQIRYSWRDQCVLARLESPLPAIVPGMMPPPHTWLPQPRLDPLHVTVVDIGDDGWRITADPLLGAGSWLRQGVPAARPILVVRPTRPSLRHAEQVLARLEPWVRTGAAHAPTQLVVMAARRWPSGVVGAAGRLLQPLLDEALFVPHHSAVAVGGVDATPLPRRLLTAVEPLLSSWNLVPHPEPRPWEGQF